MGSSEVVITDKDRQPGIALLAALPDAAICPFAQASLDESLGVGLRAIRSSEAVFDAR
jgi:hypothetical protein